MVPTLLSLALTAYQRYLRSQGEHRFYYNVENRFPCTHYHEVKQTLLSLEYCTECRLWVPSLDSYHVASCHPELLSLYWPFLDRRNIRRFVLARLHN